MDQPTKKTPKKGEAFSFTIFFSFLKCSETYANYFFTTKEGRAGVCISLIVIGPENAQER